MWRCVLVGLGLDAGIFGSCMSESSRMPMPVVHYTLPGSDDSDPETLLPERPDIQSGAGVNMCF